MKKKVSDVKQTGRRHEQGRTRRIRFKQLGWDSQFNRGQFLLNFKFCP